MSEPSRIFLCQRCFVASEEAAVAYVDERVDGAGNIVQVDRVGSVSGLQGEARPVIWPDASLLEEQHRRFLNGI